MGKEKEPGKWVNAKKQKKLKMKSRYEVKVASKKRS